MQAVKQRFRFLRKLLDMTIDVSKMLCLPLAISITTVTLLVKIETFQNWPFWLKVLIVVAGLPVALILFYATKWKEITSVFFRFKRLLYTTFAPKLLGSLYKHNLLSRLVINKAFLSQYRVALEGQNKAITGIIATLQERDHPKRFFVEGASGSGKTSLFFFIVDKLLRNKNTAYLTRRILYFDFSLSEEVQLDFIRACQNGAIDDSIVFIDNFHRLKPAHLPQVTSLAIESARASSDYGFIILSQPHDYMVTSPTGDMRIIQSIKEDNGHFILTRHYDSLFHSKDMGAFVEQARRVYGIDRESSAYPLMSLYFSRVFAMTTERAKAILQEIVAVGEKASAPARLSNDERLLIQALGVMSGLSVHIGFFRKTDYEQTFKKLLPVGLWPLSFERGRVTRILKRLARAGVVIEAVLEKRVFLFHELLAKQYREHFYGNALFDQAFAEATETILSRDWIQRDALIKWLYAVERSDEGLAQRDFHSALCSGAFKLMLDNLKRTAGLVPSMMRNQSYQLGILAEKTGDFPEARRQLKAATDAVGLSEYQKAKVDLALIEASHDSISMTILDNMLSKDIRYDINLTARYWISHLKSHLGIFDLEELESLADQIDDNWSDLMNWNEYDTVHLARRVYFDWLRFYYLRGQGDMETFSRIISHPLLDRLKESHVQNAAFLYKFAYAHFIHYEMLFSFAVLGKIMDYPQNFPGMPSELKSKEELMEKAEEYYKMAVNEFEVFGDKIVDYIRPRMLELKMCRMGYDRDKLLTELNKYQAFLERAGFHDMMGYGHTYLFKLHFLNAYRAMREGADHSARPLKESDGYIKQAFYHLDVAEQWYDRTHNGYGKATILLFRGILALFDAQPLEEVLYFEQLKALCGELNILRPLRALKKISTQAGITPDELVDSVRFFPIVHQ